jgi:leucyl aminopeptidase
MQKINWQVVTEGPAEAGLRAFFLTDEREFFAPSAERTACLKAYRERQLDQSLLLTSAELSGGDCLIPLSQFKRLNIWEAVKCAALEAFNQAVKLKISPVVLILDGPDATGFHKKALEGILLGVYAYERFKKSDPAGEDDFVPEVVIVADPALAAELPAELERITTVCQAVNQVRDLVNHPAVIFGPEEFAGEAVKTATECGLKVDVWDENRLKREGCNGLLAVGRGSRRPPRLVSLSYEPENAGPETKHVVLVGKGITFDSGGLSLKPGAGMMDMKSDMAGAAAVLGAMEIIGRLGARVRVTGLLALAENMPDGGAQRPGDVIVMKNGKSVEVKNTDAEGRLVLADALAVGADLKPDMMVDAATLTGACRVALGIQVAAVLGRDRELIGRLIAAGEESGEILWELPFEEAYLEDMKSDFADLSNISSKPYGGTITAALFLGEFVPKEISWAHLDIAGPAYPGKKWKYFAPGATGFGARIFAALVKNLG